MTNDELINLKYDLKLIAFESEVFETESLRERIDELFNYIELLKLRQSHK